MTKAAKDTYGCIHRSMLDMVALTRTDIDYYTLKGREMFNLKCINEGCTNGIVSLKWPKLRGIDDYGVYCPYVTRGECAEGDIIENKCLFVCCNTCTIKRQLKEKEMKNNSSLGGKRQRSRRSKG